MIELNVPNVLGIALGVLIGLWLTPLLPIPERYWRWVERHGGRRP